MCAYETLISLALTAPQVFDIELFEIRTCERRQVLMFSDVVCTWGMIPSGTCFNAQNYACPCWNVHSSWGDQRRTWTSWFACVETNITVVHCAERSWTLTLLTVLDFEFAAVVLTFSKVSIKADSQVEEFWIDMACIVKPLVISVVIMLFSFRYYVRCWFHCHEVVDKYWGLPLYLQCWTQTPQTHTLKQNSILHIWRYFVGEKESPLFVYGQQLTLTLWSRNLQWYLFPALYKYKYFESRSRQSKIFKGNRHAHVSRMSVWHACDAL